MGLGLNPSPPGQRVLYSAAIKKENIQQVSVPFHFIVRKKIYVDVDFAGEHGNNCSFSVLWCILELGAGHSSQGFPHAPPREQQQEARVTPTPISALQEIPPSPR